MHAHTIQYFEGPYKPQGQQKWPSSRGAHSAACLVDPLSQHAYTEQRLLVLWGEGPAAIHIHDIWVLHIHTMTWKEVNTAVLEIVFHMKVYNIIP